MDYSLADFAAQMGPEDRALMTAQLLRRQQGTDALAQANAQGNRFNTLAAVAQMANNRSAAGAAATAAQEAQRQFKPVQMGNQGFMLPGTGEFIRSPMFEEEQNAARDAKRSMLEQTLASRAEAARAAEDGRNQRAAEANQLRAFLAAQNGQLRMTLAELARQGRADRDASRPKSPAEIKAEQAAERTAKGKEGVSSTLDTLHGHYLELSKQGGIQSTQNNALTNIGARLSSSALGQMVGGAVGTREQSIRNSIANIRPMLLQDIKNATGMTAGQMNSNMELQTYLQAATDPTLDLESNLRAIAFIDQKFGTGRLSSTLGITPRSDVVAPGIPGQVPSTPGPAARGGPQRPAGAPNAAPAGGRPQAGAGGPPAGVPPAVWEAMTPEERRLFQ